MDQQNGSGCGTILLVILAIGGLAYCHHADKVKAEHHHTELVENRLSEIRSGTYQDAFGDEGCTEAGCEGHEAGWSYAKENGTQDESACTPPEGADLTSFKEGCAAYINAEEKAEEEVAAERQDGSR